MKFNKTVALQLFLFIITLITCTLSGAEHLNFYGAKYIHQTKPDEWLFYLSGLWYAIPFLSILTVHEFGHYFTAKYYGLKTSLPYFIPLWLPINMGAPFIGTMGAVIKLKTPSQTTKQYFDVGIAGPLAGFVLAMAFITYGFLNLPPQEAIYDIHPEYYEQFGSRGESFEQHAYTPEGLQRIFAEELPKGKTAEIPLFYVGSNLIFQFFEQFVVSDPSRIPNKYEMIHHPFLFAGFVALFFTALNLLPIGQLDGGHVIFGLFGKKKHLLISRIFFTGFIFYAGLGFDEISLVKNRLDDLLIPVILYIGFLYIVFVRVFPTKLNAATAAAVIFFVQFALAFWMPELEGYSGWLFFGLLLSRVLGVAHPDVLIEQKLDTKRQVLGWISLLIFILCASPNPFNIEIVSVF